MAQATSNSTRELAVARRKAMSSAGRAALKGDDRTRSESAHTTGSGSSAPAGQASRSGGTSREKSMARRRMLSAHGKTGQHSTDRTRAAGMGSGAPAQDSEATTPQAASEEPAKTCGCGWKDQERGNDAESAAAVPPAARVRARVKRQPEAAGNSSKAAALARRKALSSRGKAAMDTRGMSQAQTARAANPDLSGRELAQALREQRSRNGRAGQESSRPCGRARKSGEHKTGAAEDATWKVGASQTTHGQTVTGSMVGRDASVTGDEASTCRQITGTEYLGADTFESFCQTKPAKTPMRVGTSRTSGGNSVTGNRLGHSAKVTGDEPGTCKRVTGSEYAGAGQAKKFCADKSDVTPVTRSMGQAIGTTRKGKQVTGDNVSLNTRVTGGEAGAGRELTGAQYVESNQGKAPSKVGTSTTLRGRPVTGTEVGRSKRMTGDEPGACRDVTGDDYIGKEQYQGFCGTTPTRQDRKVNMSLSNSGNTVTGTMSGRAQRVTGNEPGTCKAVTGTPYAGLDQASDYCEPRQAQRIAARTQTIARRAGANMTGQQPGIDGKMTGAGKGACEPISGTPYVGRDQHAAACPAEAAEPGSADFPRTLDGEEWGEFGVVPPAHASRDADAHSAVTGTRYSQGHITGPFGMAAGKVTGTEEARFAAVEAQVEVAQPEPRMIEGRIKSRITGEGIDAGSKITGDDWDRCDHVTGTEGRSARVRNVTKRGGGPSAMEFMQRNRDIRNEAPQPVSRVTGSSGNTDKGATITFSGGARG